MYMRVKKLTKGVSDQMNLPALRTAMMGKVIWFVPTTIEATKHKPNVPATSIFNIKLGKRRFIATLEANEVVRRRMPVFVK